jgi:hypothetical protein
MTEMQLPPKAVREIFLDSKSLVRSITICRKERIDRKVHAQVAVGLTSFRSCSLLLFEFFAFFCRKSLVLSACSVCFSETQRHIAEVASCITSK